SARLHPRRPDLPSAPCGGCVCDALGACRSMRFAVGICLRLRNKPRRCIGKRFGHTSGKPFVGMPERQFGRLNA
ncbi:MAG: hypothetical protein ACI3ZE_01725, partial [Candidatus Woodwardiibium sp.]